MSEWQPIETAPKDGTYVLVFSDEEYAGVAVSCWLFDRWNSWVWSEDCWEPKFGVTHWMHLPEPPKK